MIIAKKEIPTLGCWNKSEKGRFSPISPLQSEKSLIMNIYVPFLRDTVLAEDITAHIVTQL